MCGFTDIVKVGNQWTCTICRRKFDQNWFDQVKASLPKSVWKQLI